eukprot:jgi/Tetstr1/457146/TSEL_043796.t1
MAAAVKAMLRAASSAAGRPFRQLPAPTRRRLGPPTRLPCIRTLWPANPATDPVAQGFVRWMGSGRAVSCVRAAEGGGAQEVDVEMGSLYDHPELYEAAFSFRDFEAEIKFLTELYAAKGGAGQLGSVLDLGCGTGRHLIALAQAGVAACAGVDASDKMLAHGAARAAQAGVSVSLATGDMRTYTHEGSADMVLILMGTLQHMLTNKDALAAMGSARDALRPGGLLVLELAHPYDLWDGTLAGSEEYSEVWDSDLGGGRKLYIEWGREGDPFDGLTQVLERTVCATITADNQHERSMLEVIDMRQFSMQELVLMAQLAGLEVVDAYGEMNMAIAVDDDEAYRLVMCLRKPA